MASGARWAGATTATGAWARAQRCCPGALGVSTPALAQGVQVPGLPRGAFSSCLAQEPGRLPAPRLLQSQAHPGSCSSASSRVTPEHGHGACQQLQNQAVPSQPLGGRALASPQGQPGSGHRVPTAAIQAPPRVPGDPRCTRGTCGSSRLARPAPRQAVFLKHSWRPETALARAGFRVLIHTSAPV